jgi:CRP-like cAMP-binding protein
MTAHPEPTLNEFTSDDFDRIKPLATTRYYDQDEQIFSEGDKADSLYFIESGRVSVRIQKFTSQEEIDTMGPGECFGEMAILSNNRRNASVVALTDANLLRVDKDVFLDLIRSDRVIAEKINHVFAERNDNLALKEKMVDITGLRGKRLHISIKGDQSMRETVFTRERYKSVVDRILPRLQPRLMDLLLNRCIYQIYIGFNNGEVITSSVFNPFGDEIHQAKKLVDESYIDRHFPKVDYEKKKSMLGRLYKTIAEDPVFHGLPDHFHHIFSRLFDNWDPLTPDDITNTLSRLSDLRKIPDYYLRNFTINMARNAIQMQFNCDGTHIVSAEDYQHFIEENL